MTVTVRPLSVDDIPAIVSLAPEFIREFHGWRTSFAPDHLEANWRALYGAGKGQLFGLENQGHVVGAIGGLAFQDFYDAQPVAADMGWFLRRDQRVGTGGIRLLRALEAWAVQRGARRLTFAMIVDRSKPLELRAFDRLGYLPREIVYGKHL